MSRGQLNIIMVAMLVAIIALATLPFIQHHADQQARERGQAAGLRLLHTFDCTYGVSLKELLSSGAYSTSLQASASYELAKHQHGPARTATTKIAKAQTLRAADLLRQYGQIRPLGPRNLPC